MVSDSVVRAALFPWGDIPQPPADHPDRLVEVLGVRVYLGAGVPFAFVLPERIPAGELRAVVTHVRGRVREEGYSSGVWAVPEAASPPGLAVRLQELGMVPNAKPPFEPRFASMVASETPERGPPEVDAHRVRTFNEFRQAIRVGAGAFAMDAELATALEARAELMWPFQSEQSTNATFVAAIDGDVVGYADASFGQTAVYLGGGGTHPDHRGRGVYRSLVRARWDAAVARGTPALTVGAGDMSRPILERLGFSIVGWTDCLNDDLSG